MALTILILYTTNHGIAQPKRTGARRCNMSDKKTNDKPSISNENTSDDDTPLEKLIENALWQDTSYPGETLYKKVKDKVKQIINLTTGGA